MSQNGAFSIQSSQSADHLAELATDDVKSRLRVLFESALVDMFEYYACVRPTLRIVVNPVFEDSSASSIEFAGDTLCGSAALVATTAVTYLLAGNRSIDPLDWLGEFNNQLVGRFKNRLTKQGVFTQMGTPKTIDCEMLNGEAVGIEPTFWRVDWNNGGMMVMLAIEFSDHFEFGDVDAVAVAEEGSVDLF